MLTERDDRLEVSWRTGESSVEVGGRDDEHLESIVPPDVVAGQRYAEDGMKAVGR